MIYKWKDGARQRLDPQVVGERLEQLRDRDGSITARATVEDARGEESLLHYAFTWDNDVAADQYRLVEARELIRSVVIIPDASYGESAPQEIRAFVIIGEPNQQTYTSVYTAMSDAQLRQQVVQRALRELRQWRERYREYAELAHIFEAMDKQAA